MAIKGDSQTVREMKKDISQTIKDLEHMSEGIRSGMQATGGWDDDKASEFNLAMSKVARMIESPVESLRAALPKLERLAQLMDQYSSKRFS